MPNFLRSADNDARLKKKWLTNILMNSQSRLNNPYTILTWTFRAEIDIRNVSGILASRGGDKSCREKRSLCKSRATIYEWHSSGWISFCTLCRSCRNDFSFLFFFFYLFVCGIRGTNRRCTEGDRYSLIMISPTDSLISASNNHQRKIERLICTLDSLKNSHMKRNVGTKKINEFEEVWYHQRDTIDYYFFF